MKHERLFDVDQIAVAVDKARQHAEKVNRPLALDRIALYLGVTTEEYGAMMIEMEARANKGDEGAIALSRALKMAKQESRADLVDRMNDPKGQPAGPIHISKVNHGMIETTKQEIEFKRVVFSGEDEIPD